MKVEQKVESTAQLNAQAESLSALVDGEMRESEFDALFGAGNAGADLHARWHCYQLMGEAMREAVPSTPLRDPQSFLIGVMSGLPPVRPDASQLVSGIPTAQVRAPASNDAVLRWKMLAGFASVAAVVAVSWSVLSGIAAVSPASGLAAPQLAQAAPEVAVPSALSAQPVAVNTEQGTLIRDARLEQLMAEHRQFGGATALQMPAGFLRNATYETAPQR